MQQLEALKNLWRTRTTQGVRVVAFGSSNTDLRWRVKVDVKVLTGALSNTAEVRMSETQLTAPKRHRRPVSSSKPDWSSVFAWLWRYGLVAIFVLSGAHLALLAQEGRLARMDLPSTLCTLLFAYTALCGYFVVQVAVWSDHRISLAHKLFWLLAPLSVVGPVCVVLLLLTFLAA
jgi:hypothetical protein